MDVLYIKCFFGKWYAANRKHQKIHIANFFMLQEKPESEKRELCVSAFVITAAIISKLDQLTVIIFIFLKTSKNDLIGRFVIMF